MTVPEIQISRQIVAVTKRAEALGLVQNAQGNFSVRIPDKNCFMITPHGILYADIAPEDLVTVDPDGHIMHGEHDSSSEADVHAPAYRRYKAVGACVDVEPIFINTLSTPSTARFRTSSVTSSSFSEDEALSLDRHFEAGRATSRRPRSTP